MRGLRGRLMHPISNPLLAPGRPVDLDGDLPALAAVQAERVSDRSRRVENVQESIVLALPVMAFGLLQITTVAIADEDIEKPGH